MNDHPCIRIAVGNGPHDFVEREKDDVVQFRIEKAQQEIRGCITTGNGDPPSLQLSHPGKSPGDDQRAAASPQCPAGAKEAILLADKSEQVAGYLRDIQLTIECQPVEGFHILQPFAEAEFRADDQPVNERIKYKGVIGAGRIA